LLGWFIGGNTSIVAVVRVWVFSFGVFCVMGGIFYLLQDSVAFDNLMHGKAIKKDAKQRSLEDFGAFSARFRLAVLTCVSSRVSATCFDPTRKERVDLC
jgi:H+-transporting ATPase